MTAKLSIEQLSVRYHGRRLPALKEVSLEVRGGEVIGVAGRTGAGKSTLALAAAGFVPRVVRAVVSGTVTVDGVAATKAELAQLAGHVGIVFSTPALQLSASKPTVREELAFGLENLAIPRSEMDARIDVVLERLHIGHLAEREPLALSGGEQQRVAIASIVVLNTDVLVLDEPAAQLDPAGTAAVADLLVELAADGRAVVVAEHSAEVLARTQRCLVLDAGVVSALAPPTAALGSPTLEPLGLRAPTVLRLAEVAGVAAARAFDEQAIARALRAAGSARPIPDRAAPVALSAPNVRLGEPPSIEVRGLTYDYPGGVRALQTVDLAIRPGESVAIVGQNGSGKTTLVKHFNGLLRPTSGTVLVDGADIRDRRVSELAGSIGFVFQNPDDQLFRGRVDDEVAFGPRNLHLPPGQTDRLIDAALELVGLAAQRAVNPYDLGFSLRKLVALASVLAMEPPVLVLDEPTTGQDGPGVERVGAIVDAWRAAGRTVVTITHDMEFAASHFGRIVVMRQGEIVLDGPPATAFDAHDFELLASTGLRPPPAARIGAQLGLRATPTYDALLSALG